MKAKSLRCVTSSDFNWKKAGSLSESLNISTTQRRIQGRGLKGPEGAWRGLKGPEGLDPPLQLAVAFIFKADPHIPVSSVTLVTQRRTNATVGR